MCTRLSNIEKYKPEVHYVLWFCGAKLKIPNNKAFVMHWHNHHQRNQLNESSSL